MNVNNKTNKEADKKIKQIISCFRKIDISCFLWFLCTEMDSPIMISDPIHSNILYDAYI